MSPRIANKDRPELPTPKVRTGSLGLCPFSNWSVSAYSQDVGDVILDLASEQGSSILQKTVVRTDTGEVDLTGVYYKNLADALYRGHMPQVTLCALTVEQLPGFVNEILSYVEKMLSLGFMMEASPMDGGNTVSQHLPYFVLLGPGVYYQRLIQTLERQLGFFHHLSARQRGQILSRFFRAHWPDLPVAQLASLQTPVAVSALPDTVKIARPQGPGAALACEIIPSILNLHGLAVEWVSHPVSATACVEFESAYPVVTGRILPMLENNAPAASASLLETCRAGLQSIAQVLHCALDPQAEGAGKRQAKRQVKPQAAQPLTPLTATDLSITTGLSAVADQLGLTTARETLWQVSKQLQDQA